MNVRIIYTAPCEINIHFCEGYELESAVWGHRFGNLQDAIDMSKFILRYVYPHSATGIMICDATTGEILAEIERGE